MAKKLEKIVEEVKEIEVKLAADFKSTFHTICTKFGNVEFVDGKASIASDNKDLLNELQNLNAIHPLEKPPEQGATSEASETNG
jgi:hypothetical protein